MEKIKKNFGFGYMRLPMQGDTVDTEQTVQMVDAFLAAGFNYFDTAHGYLDGKSELSLKECLTSRYPRESYVLTNKLSTGFFHCKEDIRPLFQQQLEACGVEYFDFYLMHAQNAQRFAEFKACQAYETALELKDEGKIRHFGISFHDSAEVLEQILTEYPQIEVVQIQFNYLDYADPAIQSKAVYDVCRKYGKGVIIMEPVKGGHLADVPEKARDIFAALGGSPASFALRFAASFEGVFMVLSGMSNMAQMVENTALMASFQPLNEAEMASVQQVQAVFAAMNLIPCTACRYCVPGCPQGIPIPEFFSTRNAKAIHKDWNADYYYGQSAARSGVRASDCVGCGACEDICPQHLPIRQLLQDTAKEFDQ